MPFKWTSRKLLYLIFARWDMPARENIIHVKQILKGQWNVPNYFTFSKCFTPFIYHLNVRSNLHVL